MSDISSQAPADTAAQDTGAPPASLSTDLGAAAAAAQSASSGEPAEGQGEQEQPETFSREYVEELRRENAKHRTAAKEFEEAFAGYDQDSRAALLDITRQLADPNTQPAAAKRLQAIAEKIMDAQQSGVPTRPDGEEDPDQRPMTRAEWKAEQARIQEESQQKAAIDQIESESRSLGIEPGSLEYAELLFLAQEPDVAGDLTKAKEKLDAHYAAKAQAVAQTKAQSAEKWPGVPGTSEGTGAADAEGGQTKTYADARKGALAFLRAKAGAVQ